MRAPGEQQSDKAEGPRQAQGAYGVPASPPFTAAQLMRGTTQAATIGIFFILLITALSLARPVLLPLASAFVVTMMLGPLSARADRAGVPAVVTALVLWLLVIAALYGLIVLLSAPAVGWIEQAPEIGRRVQDKLLLLDQPLSALRNLREALLPSDSGKDVGFDLMDVVRPAVGIVTPAIGQMLVFFGVLFFMLLGRNHFRQMIVVFFRHRKSRLRTLKILNDIESHLTGYLSVVTLINLGVGVAAGTIAFAVGLPDPIAWGVLGFLLNYVPYVGALLMELAMFLVGLVTFETVTHAMIPPLMYVAVNFFEGHFLTPSIVGRKLTLNPLTVFLALVFWAWLWGPVGAFLAVPLLIIGLVAVMHLFPKQGPDLPD